MDYEFSDSLPKEIPEGSSLLFINQVLKGYYNELDERWNNKSILLPQEVKKIERRITDLQSRKQIEERKILISLELNLYHSNLAMLTPTFP